MEQGVLSACPDAEVLQIPLADGGDGFLEAVLAAAGGNKESVTAMNALGQRATAPMGWLSPDQAVIDMSLISGLAMIPPKDRNGMAASSVGTGQMILHAISRGAKKILLGIGGSATSDGGAGAATALGLSLLDNQGQPLLLGAGDLARLDSLKLDVEMIKKYTTVSLQVACDVDNPLLGPRGCARIFSPQKGVPPEELPVLETTLEHWANLLEAATGNSSRNIPGAGAAGGMGFMLHNLLNAELVSGAELIMQAAGFAEKCKGADLILTCEGALDEQTAEGKLPALVARHASAMGIPVIAFAGILKPGWQKLHQQGLTAAWALADGPISFADSINRAAELLSSAAFQATSLVLATTSHSRRS